MYQEISRNKTKTVILIASFFILLAILGWIISKVVGSPVIFLVMAVGSILYSIFGYFGGAKLATSVNGAHEISKKDNPRLYRIVENLAITTGLPMPKVYIMEDPAPNAFAAGRNPEHSLVCATTGLLDMMDDNELEAVMAHEMGHIQNYDIRVNTIAFALVGVISLIADVFLHLVFWGDDDNRNPLFLVLGVVAAILIPITATLIQLSISRKREYLADASGALTTRYPEALASALEKIAHYGSALKKQNTSTAHLFFANPLKQGSFVNLLSTHPPIEDRIAKLRDMKL